MYLNVHLRRTFHNIKPLKVINGYENPCQSYSTILYPLQKQTKKTFVSFLRKF